MRADPSARLQAARLRRSRELDAVFSSRLAAHGRAVVVHGRHRGDDQPARWTVVAGRKVGGAVARNRAKRRLRAALRAAALPNGWDIVAVARSRAVSARFDDLQAETAHQVAAVVAQGTG